MNDAGPPVGCTNHGLPHYPTRPFILGVTSIHPSSGSLGSGLMFGIASIYMYITGANSIHMNMAMGASHTTGAYSTDVGIQFSGIFLKNLDFETYSGMLP